MSKSNRQQVILAAYNLYMSAPTMWKEFVEAFEELVNAKCIEAIGASNENAHVSRGHAQAYLDLLDTFKNLDEHAKKIKH